MEGCFGSGKRTCSLDLMTARLPKGAENSISMACVVMRAEKILRLLRLFFVIIFTWLWGWQWPCSLWIGYRNIWQLETADSLVAVDPCP